MPLCSLCSCPEPMPLSLQAADKTEFFQGNAAIQYTIHRRSTV